MTTGPEPQDERGASETVHIGWLPVGTRVRWTDGAGRAHEGVLVPWPDHPKHVEGVRVIETIVTEIPHVVPELRHVEVVYVEEGEGG